MYFASPLTGMKEPKGDVAKSSETWNGNVEGRGNFDILSPHCWGGSPEKNKGGGGRLCLH